MTSNYVKSITIRIELLILLYGTHKICMKIAILLINIVKFNQFCIFQVNKNERFTSKSVQDFTRTSIQDLQVYQFKIYK